MTTKPVVVFAVSGVVESSTCEPSWAAVTGRRRVLWEEIHEIWPSFCQRCVLCDRCIEWTRRIVLIRRTHIVVRSIWYQFVSEQWRILVGFCALEECLTSRYDTKYGPYAVVEVFLSKNVFWKIFLVLGNKFQAFSSSFFFRIDSLSENIKYYGTPTGYSSILNFTMKEDLLLHLRYHLF